MYFTNITLTFYVISIYVKNLTFELVFILLILSHHAQHNFSLKIVFNKLFQFNINYILIRFFPQVLVLCRYYYVFLCNIIIYKLINYLIYTIMYR